MDELDTVAESTLRRALRLDADERAPRLDAAAIAAAAGHRSVQERLLRVVRGLALVGASLGIEAAVALAAFDRLADLDPSGLFAGAIGVFAVVAERILPLAALAMDPSVAAASLAAVIFATVYERSVGRESVRVRAS